MSMKNPKAVFKAGQEAKDGLDAVKARIASLRVRQALAERNKDSELINQTKVELERSVKPKASRYVREAAERASEIKAFRESRQSETKSRCQKRSRNEPLL